MPSSSTTMESPVTTVTSTTLPVTSTSAATTTTTEPEIKRPRGGEAVIAVAEEPATLNSFLAKRTSAVVSVASTIGQAYAAGVSDVDGTTLELIPELVTELPTVANGGVTMNEDGTMTVRYTIRDEAAWDDGTPISGDDFQFTLDTIMDPDLAIDKTNYEDIIASSVGAKTFEYTMSRPTMAFELLFDEIIPKHQVEGTDFANDWNDTRWASAGPFRFKEWDKGRSLTLERNDNYWKVDDETEQQLPYLDSVKFTFSPTGNVISPFLTHQADVISPEWNTADYERLTALAPRGARIQVRTGAVWEHLNFQFGPGRLDRNETSCTDNYDMRKAIAQSIDKDRLTREIYGFSFEPLSTYVQAYAPALAQNAWDQYPFDPEAASASYARAVETEGVECSVVFSTGDSDRDGPARIKTAELLEEMLTASGIPYRSEIEPAAEFLGRTVPTGTWDVGEWHWIGSPGLFGLVRIHDVFDPDGAPPFGSNFYRWGTEGSSVSDAATKRFADVRDEMNATADEELLIPLINEAEAIIANELVIIPLYARPSIAAVWKDAIGGFAHNPTSASFTWNIEFWYRADLDP